MFIVCILRGISICCIMKLNSWNSLHTGHFFTSSSRRVGPRLQLYTNMVDCVHTRWRISPACNVSAKVHVMASAHLWHHWDIGKVQKKQLHITKRHNLLLQSNNKFPVTSRHTHQVLRLFIYLYINIHLHKQANIIS